ncbi:MAG: sigma-54 dependent transcriptional regulator [Deltaproteobacteria bacterium]|jgi:two-component system NtrC family response regulator|nr:sigma-54 dependent transcriptional regulator [Deltaproteobacteria bacterium]
MKRLLVIDDEAALRMLVRAIMESVDWQVTEAASGLEAVKIFSDCPDLFDVALLDMRMPGLDGHATLARLHEIRPDFPVVILTAFGTVGSAVDAMKRGAFDYITKPADNDELITVLEKAYQYSSLLHENARLRQELDLGVGSRLLGNSRAMQQVMDFVRQVAPSEATVLIMGESGTGKELVAEALHNASNRASRSLIKVNCAALPGQLLESELFGYEKGAFTGAFKDKPGRFMLARGGSIFLDEIGELPLELQAKLLRVLQEKTVEPLGSVKAVPVDVRIICASNRNLRQEVQEGRFREDLYFRLNVLEITLPPLRERLDDLPLLVNGLLKRLSRKNNKEVRRVLPAFIEALAGYHWPGNVRELENVLERTLILSRSDVLGPEALPAQLFSEDGAAGRRQTESPAFSAETPAFPEESDSAGQDFAGPLEKAEYDALVQALRENHGHRERTADALGVSRRTLQYKLKKFGLNRNYRF